MKLTIAKSALLPASAMAYTMGGFDMFGRPTVFRTYRVPPGYCGGPCNTGQPSSVSNRRDVDRAFEELIREIEIPPSEESVRKTKDLVDRSFQFFNELNRDVVMSEEEIAFNEEMLRKQQKWANEFIDFAAELGKEFQVDTSGSRNVSVKSQSRAYVPLYSIKDEESVFQVELEVPGVSMDDIDIELKDGNMLIISGTRRSLVGETGPFSKSFMLDETVDLESISASLTNGILTVSAPKKSKEEKRGKSVKIPIVSRD